MKIALIAPTYLPSRRANTIQVMKIAQAFTVLAHAVRVWVPGVAPEAGTDWQEIAHHYGLQHAFEIGWLATRPQLRSYDYGLLSVKQVQRWSADLVYTRLPQAAAIASMMGLPTVFEVHDLPQGRLGSRGKFVRAVFSMTYLR